MPTYDYKCKACEHAWEEFQPITSDPTRKCPSCKKNKAERVISGGGGLIFKGSGFYITDYRSDSYKKGADAEKPAASSPKSETGSESKSESSSKPAPAKESKN